MTLRLHPGKGPSAERGQGLVERALAEHAAERELYRRHSRAIRRFVLEMLGDPSDASDAVQETFARAFRQLSTLSEPSAFTRWLFGIARNVSLESIKARRGFRRICSEAATLTPPVACDDPERACAERQSAELAARALARMPRRRWRASAPARAQLNRSRAEWDGRSQRLGRGAPRPAAAARAWLSLVLLLAVVLTGAQSSPPSDAPDGRR
jgi:RNA polymerase sigma-70 factor (ECF subfamily)